MKRIQQDYIKRYTNLPALIYLLTNRVITLLDPMSWDDTNDSYYLTIYKQERSLKTILALSFTATSETYHHWRVFAGSSSGICITFKRERLLDIVRRIPGVTCEPVDYKTLNKMRGKNHPVNWLPFIKRHGFQDECEFRIIYESKRATLSTKDIKIPLTSIEKITLSPWIKKALLKSVKESIQSINGCNKIKIYRSTLVGNMEWKKLASKAS
jgi:hypothetical protein